MNIEIYNGEFIRSIQFSCICNCFYYWEMNNETHFVYHIAEERKKKIWKRNLYKIWILMSIYDDIKDDIWKYYTKYYRIQTNYM